MAASLAGAGLLLAACAAGSPGGDTGGSALSGSASSGASTRSPVLARAFGEYVGVGSSCQSHSDLGCNVRFSVTKVTDCVAGGSPGGPPVPAGTRRKVVWLEVSTGPGFTDSAETQDLVTDFTSIDSRGVTSGSIRADSMGPCVPRHQRIGPPLDQWQPGKKYAGGVEVFLPDGAVKIVNGRNTVEWTLP